MTEILVPDLPAAEHFTDATAAVDRLEEIYARSTRFLCDGFARVMADGPPPGRIRAFYPEIRITTTSYAQVDSRLSYGHVAEPGIHATTVTRPDLFRQYLIQQIELLMRNLSATQTNAELLLRGLR